MWKKHKSTIELIFWITIVLAGCIYLYKTKNNSMVLKFARTHNNKSKIIDRCDKMKNMLDNKEWDSFNGRTARSYLDS